MQNSLTLLQDDSGEYVNRCTLLENFKNKFETSMSPDIISALNSKSTGNKKTSSAHKDLNIVLSSVF